MRKMLFLLAVLCLFYSISIAQIIHGHIIDLFTNKPIVGASIYINGSYNGTASKADGSFQLNASKDRVPLIVSHIGYESQNLVNYTNKDTVIALKPRQKTLSEVTIGYNSMLREQEMKVFKRKFLGSTSDKDCIIENPNDISFNFYRKQDSLVATADKPLIIRNKKLGYKITYILTVFTYTPGRVHYGGNYFFKEDVAGLSEQEIVNVQHRRNAAYWGSRMHFIRSLWRSELTKNWFEIWSPTGPLAASEVLVNKNGDVYFYPNTFVGVQYLGDWTGVKATKPGSGSYITASGYSDGNISWWGEMGFDRVDKLLPFEFEPTNASTVL